MKWGVVRLFGKVWQERVEPGLHYRPPFPFTRLDKVKVRQVRRVAVGAELPDILVGRQANPLMPNRIGTNHWAYRSARR